MPWKTDEAGNVMIDAGNPVFQHPDGREEPFNADAMMLKVKELTTESAKHRKNYRQSQGNIQPLLDAGIEDIPQYLKEASDAISLVKTYKEKGNPGVEEIERIKQSVASSFESRLTEKDKVYAKALKEKDDAMSAKDKLVHKQFVKGFFETSEFLREKTHLLPDFAYDSLGSRFVVEQEGEELKAYALGNDNEKIFSSQGTSYADPHEAIEILIKSHPQKDKLLKSGSGGSGAQGGGSAPQFTGRTIDAGDQAAASRNLEKIASGEVVIA
jgi:hypothetical protein